MDIQVLVAHKVYQAIVVSMDFQVLADLVALMELQDFQVIVE